MPPANDLHRPLQTQLSLFSKKNEWNEHFDSGQSFKRFSIIMLAPAL